MGSFDAQAAPKPGPGRLVLDQAGLLQEREMAGAGLSLAVSP
jgi:hypothetical protein